MIQRSNASKDLNQLVKEGRVQKSDTRPVRYWVAQDARSGPEKYVPSYKENRPKERKLRRSEWMSNWETVIFFNDHWCERQHEKCCRTSQSGNSVSS